MAPRRRHIEQLQRRGFSTPRGSCSASTTPPQWQRARWRGWMGVGPMWRWFGMAKFVGGLRAMLVSACDTLASGQHRPHLKLAGLNF